MEKAQILIVEDDGIIAMDLESRLKSFGYSVPAIVAYGEQAIQKVEEHRIDIVMMDILLKGEIDGIDAADQIRTQFNIPVVFVTAHMDEDRLERSKLTLPFGYVLKPFSDRELKTTIEMALYTSKVDAERRLAEEALGIRNEINNIFLTHPDEEMYAEMLKVILKVMESEYGTFGYFDDDGSFVAPAVTRKIYWNKCNVPEKEIIFQKGTFGGIWGKAIKEKKTLISNDGPFKVPEGHIPIVNTMVIPIIFRDEVISAIHIANKPDGYDEEDRTMLKTIADNIAPVLYSRLQRDRQDKERKKMEVELQETKKELDIIFNSVPALVWSKSNEGKYLRVNRTYCETVGLSMEKILGRTDYDLYPADIADQYSKYDQEIINSKKPVLGIEERHLKPSGDYGWSLTQKLPYYNAEGNIVGTLGFAINITELKRAAETLRESEERHRLFFENSPIGIIHYNNEGIITAVNDAMIAIFGSSREKLIGLDINDIPDKKFSKEVYKSLNGEPGYYEAEYKSYTGGKAAIIKASWIPIIRDGEVIAGVGMVEDVTEKQQAGEALRESEKKYRTLLETTSEGYWLLNPERKTVEVNEALSKMLGYSQDEMLGKTPFDFVDDENRKIFIEQTSKISVTDHRSFEITLKKKNGEDLHAYFNATTIRDESGEVQSSFALITDITERRRAEEALRESQEKYRSIMEAMNDAAYICLPDFRIEYLNPAMTKKIGRYTIGESCHKVIHGLDEKCSWCVHGEVMQGEYVKKEIVSPKDGKTYHISNSPIFHTDGSISKLSIFRNITEVKKMQEQLQQAQKMESIGTLAGGIAHDFNNILFPMMGYAEMMLDDLPADSPHKKNTNAILQGTKRARDLIKQILIFSRQADQELKPLKVQLVIKEVLKLIRSSLPSTIEIKQNVSNKCDLVLADFTQIHQIAMNLMTNAYQAMEDEGGEMEVTLKRLN